MNKSLQEVPFESVRVGVVSSVNREKGTARVYFEDREYAVSHDLKVIVPQTMKTKYYWMPDVDETVICLFLANGQETGYIVGSVYSDVDKPHPSIGDNDHDAIHFEDGTFVKYEANTRTLYIDCVGDINIRATGDIKMQARNIYLN